MVIHRASQRHRLFTHRFAGFFIQERGGCFFDNLLMTALQRAFPFAQIEDVAVAVAQHLNFNMAWLFDVFLDEYAVVAKGGAGFIGGTLEAVHAFIVIPGDAHPLAATASARFEHDRIADAAGDLQGMVAIPDNIGIAGYGADPGFLGQNLGGDLVAHRIDGFHLRADEDDPFLFQRFAKSWPLRQEPVTGMYRFRPGIFAGLQDAVDQQIALRCGWRADQDGFVSHFDV